MAIVTLNKSYSMLSKLAILGANEPDSELEDGHLYVWTKSEEVVFGNTLMYDGFDGDDFIDSIVGTVESFIYNQGDATNHSTTFQITGLNLDVQELINLVDGAKSQTSFFGEMLSGDDVINGTSGKDTLLGYDGDDSLYSNGGTDTLVGGNGNDTYYISDAKTKITETVSGGNDTISTDLSTFSLAKIKYVENLMYSGVNNVVFTGSTVDNAISGSAGNDTLDGGLGNDTLTGGSGADIFKFTSKIGSTNVDTLTDFSVDSDTIQLSKKIFTSLSKGFSAENFVNGTAAVDTNDYLIYDQTTGALYYDADGSGTKSQAIKIVAISEGTALTYTDITVA